MSRLRGVLGREKMTDSFIILAIILSASIIIVPFLIPRPPPEITLYILTQDDVSITTLIEEDFLNSSFAREHNIVDIEWVSFDYSMWNLVIGSGTIDIVMDSYERIIQFGQTGLLGPISNDILSGVNESIAGVPMKGYLSLSEVVWCCYGIYISIFEILVNETLLQENGLEIPATIEELLSPEYASLIGMDIPGLLSIEHQFQHLMTKAHGWEDGIKNLTALYANSRMYEHEGDAETALLNGEIAITLTAFTGHPHEELPFTIIRSHLENQVVIVPDSIGIANASDHDIESEAFIEYLLTPECQAMLVANEGIRMPIRREAFESAQYELDESLYAEFNWTASSEGIGVTDLLVVEDFTLWLYMNSTIFSAWDNLTNCWDNIRFAFENGSITQQQLEEFQYRLGEPLAIIDPDTLENEVFTELYASEIHLKLYWIDFAIEVSHRWKVAANQRYAEILNDLSMLF